MKVAVLPYVGFRFEERSDCDYCTVETDLGPKPTRDVCEELTDGTKRCTECKKRNARICPGPCESGATVYGNNQLCGECQHEVLTIETTEK